MSGVLLFISGQEIIFILLMVLLLFGSKEIPRLARTFGKGMREFRKATEDIKKEIESSTPDLMNDVNEIKRNLTREANEIKRNITRETDTIERNISREAGQIRKNISRDPGEANENITGETGNAGKETDAGKESAPGDNPEKINVSGKSPRKTSVKSNTAKGGNHSPTDAPGIAGEAEKNQGVG